MLAAGISGCPELCIRGSPQSMVSYEELLRDMPREETAVSWHSTN